jgi:hypothetical protein
MMSPGDIWVKIAHSSGGNLSLAVSVLPTSLVRETKSSNLVSKFDFQKRDSVPVQLTRPGVWVSMGRTEAHRGRLFHYVGGLGSLSIRVGKPVALLKIKSPHLSPSPFGLSSHARVWVEKDSAMAGGRRGDEWSHSYSVCEE